MQFIFSGVVPEGTGIRHPHFANQVSLWRVTVCNRPPAPVDLVYFGLIPQPFSRSRVRDFAPWNWIGFDESMRNIDAEAIDAAVKPPFEDRVEFLPNFLVPPVEVRLRGVECMEVPLPIGASSDATPCGPTENGLPVVRCPFASCAATGREVETMPRRRSGFRSNRFLEPAVPIRAVIRYDVHKDFEPPGMRVFEESVEIFERSVHRIDITIVGDVVSMVALGGTENRVEPYCIAPQRRNVSKLLPEPIDIPVSVPVCVLEGAQIYLVDTGVAPPFRLVGLSDNGMAHV